jgi:hypothetical protein
MEFESNENSCFGLISRPLHIRFGCTNVTAGKSDGERPNTQTQILCS